MRKMLISSAAALLCAAALPAAAAPSAVAAPVTQNSSQDDARAEAPASQPRARSGDRNRLICRTARVSETRIPQRICQTQAEWALDQAERD